MITLSNAAAQPLQIARQGCCSTASPVNEMTRPVFVWPNDRINKGRAAVFSSTEFVPATARVNENREREREVRLALEGEETSCADRWFEARARPPGAGSDDSPSLSRAVNRIVRQFRINAHDFVVSSEALWAFPEWLAASRNFRLLPFEAAHALRGVGAAGVALLNLRQRAGR